MKSDTFIFTAQRGRDWLKKQGYPYSDNESLKKSMYTYSNGARYGTEIPVINNLSILEKTIKWLDYFGLKCDRFNETCGAFLLPEYEIKQMLQLCKENQIGITFSLSPRPEYDNKSSFYFSKYGMEQCRKLNNIDAVAAAIDEALYLADLGCRGLVIYDPGVLFLLNEMRQEGQIPCDMYFLGSSHMMATHPVNAKLLYDAGANSLVTIHDASLAVLQATRLLCPDLILDVPIDVYKDKGGYIRYNQLAEIIQISSPVILKLGASAQGNPYDSLNDDIIKNRVKIAHVAIEHLKRALNEPAQQRLPKEHSCLPVI